jgi:hypothetical protein
MKEPPVLLGDFLHVARSAQEVLLVLRRRHRCSPGLFGSDGVLGDRSRLCR